MLSVQLSASATFAPAGAAHLTYATPAGAPGAAALLALDTGYLSDVSTGVWTPTVSFGGASVGVTYSSQTGTFTKIGKLVVLNWRVALLTKGVSTGVVTVDGLPFTPAVNTFSNGFINSGTALPVQIMTMVQVGVASSRHVYNNGTVIASLDDTNITNASVFTGTSIFSVP